MATFLFIEDGKITPITRYGNIEKFVGALKTSLRGRSKRQQEQSQTSPRRLRTPHKIQFPPKICPESSNGRRLQFLGDFARSALMVSSMHFMDPYNFDLERVQRCVIHYAVPDGRIIPFCTMNSIHRAEVEKKLGVPIKEWKEKHKVEISQPI